MYTTYKDKCTINVKTFITFITLDDKEVDSIVDQ